MFVVLTILMRQNKTVLTILSTLKYVCVPHIKINNVNLSFPFTTITQIFSLNFSSHTEEIFHFQQVLRKP